MMLNKTRKQIIVILIESCNNEHLLRLEYNSVAVIFHDIETPTNESTS